MGERTRKPSGDEVRVRAAAVNLLLLEEEHALKNWGGWIGWLHEVEDEALAALRLRRALGLKMPAELRELGEVLRG